MILLSFILSVTAAGAAASTFRMAPGPVRCVANVVAAVAFLARALLKVLAGDWGQAIMDAVLAGLFAYLAWRDRPRGKRWAARVAARVRVRGPRLVVEPA